MRHLIVGELPLEVIEPAMEEVDEGPEHVGQVVLEPRPGHEVGERVDCADQRLLAGLLTG